MQKSHWKHLKAPLGALCFCLITGLAPEKADASKGWYNRDLYSLYPTGKSSHPLWQEQEAGTDSGAFTHKEGDQMNTSHQDLTRSHSQNHAQVPDTMESYSRDLALAYSEQMHRFHI